MKFRRVLDPLIGSALVSAKSLYANEENSCIGIRYDLERGSFVVLAVEDNDSIAIQAVVDENSGIGKFDSSSVLLLDAPISGAHVGEIFANYWLCKGGPNYVDGVDFGFGDLNFPNVKLLCSLSEVLEFSIKR